MTMGRYMQAPEFHRKASFDEVAPCEQAAMLDRALRYPYSRPEEDFLFNCGTSQSEGLPDWQTWMQAERDAGGAERFPVLSVGSNAAPEQLARKFPASDFAGFIPVVACDLHDFDSVYAATVTSYGSIPATVFPASGATLMTYLTYLTREQLNRMNETEGAYRLVSLRSARLEYLNGVAEICDLLAYEHKAGALMTEGAFTALAAVSCRNRSLKEASEEVMLQRVTQLFDVPCWKEFVFRAVHQLHRRGINKRLRQCGVAPRLGEPAAC